MDENPEERRLVDGVVDVILHEPRVVFLFEKGVVRIGVLTELDFGPVVAETAPGPVVHAVDHKVVVLSHGDVGFEFERLLRFVEVAPRQFAGVDQLFQALGVEDLGLVGLLDIPPAAALQLHDSTVGLVGGLTLCGQDPDVKFFGVVSAESLRHHPHEERLPVGSAPVPQQQHSFFRPPGE